MSIRTIFAATTATVLAASCSATAPALQDSRYGPDRGESEVNFAVSISSQETDPDGGSSQTTDVLFGQIGGGYFLTEEQEVGGQVVIASVSPEDSAGDASTLGIFPYYRWNFRGNERNWWYVGVQVGLQSVDAGGEDDSSFGYGAHAGFKSWFTQQVAFFVEPRYNMTELEFAGTDSDVTDFTILLGLSVVL